jgi:2-C-methyl-D-erythritol 2,4-cyclodiphosphate synthase
MAHRIPFRIGHGYDIHRLQEGGKLVLGTIPVSTEMSPIAHSDGDVVIHALVDALLGAVGQGDIGELFPNTDPKFKDAPSTVFLNYALMLVRSAGYNVGNVDITILAERPKLKEFKGQMSKRLSELVEAPVNIKAGTHEGCDAVGEGKAIACHAAVMLVAF